MSPPFKKPAIDPNRPPYAGGYATYRKSGARTKRGLIQHIYADGSMRVRPDTGRATIITPSDIQRAHRETK